MRAPPLLLCTDLDRTLLPNGPQPESPGARVRFARFVAASGAALAYVTGRDRRLVEEAIAAFGIPRPQFVIADVGTTIYDLRAGAWTAVAEWQAAIAPDWRGQDAGTLAGWLRDVDGLALQEPHKQGSFKLSYYLPLEHRWPDVELEIRRRLRGRDLRVNLVHSIDEMAAIGLVDVLPAAAGKLPAIEFLRVMLGVLRPNTLYAGDSGNDLAALASAIPAVLVANALPEVAAAARAAAERCGASQALYVATGGFHGMNGNYSAGILEGAEHFHPELFGPEP
jgi:HAD superfamily hydrolase (TIGR01484 family)